MKKFLKISIVLIPLSTLFFALYFTSTLLEDEPLVSRIQSADVESAKHAKETIKRSLKTIMKANDRAEITLSEKEINSLLAFASRGVNRFSGYAEIGPWGLSASATFTLPHNPLGDYINFGFGIEPSGQGLRIFNAFIGKIKISGKHALTILRMSLNLVAGETDGEVLDSVHSVQFKNRDMIVKLKSLHLLKAKWEGLKNRIKDIRDEVALLGDPHVIRQYYALLLELGEKIPQKETVSLSYFVGPVFQLAKERSIDGNEAEENQAAILALASYLGSWRFASLAGQVLTEEMKQKKGPSPRAALSGRKDLRLHFVISAGIKIVSDQGITYAIGELKELIDAGNGGSGFSFVDLAADRAGTRFARMATDPDGGARRLQELLSIDAGEHVFFPEALDLPEGLSKEAFEKTYGGVESSPYLAMVNEIDSRISQLPLHSK